MTDGTHTEHEDDPWTRILDDGHPRVDTPWFRAAKAAMHKIVATLSDWFYGSGPWQAHHGGSLWLYDAQGWFLVRNLAGIEYSAQWCSAPESVELLRLNAKRLYTLFPETLDQFEALGYHDARAILDEPITDAQGVGRWTDSIYNSCVPLAAPPHVGTIKDQNSIAGVHHYPAPVQEIEYIKRADFVLWAVDPQGRSVGVAPVAAPGSGDARVQVLYAEPGSALHVQLGLASDEGHALVLDADHPIAKQAFALQAPS